MTSLGADAALLSVGEFAARLAREAREGLTAAGNDEDRIKGHLYAVQAALTHAGIAYRDLMDDRNRLAREAADRADDEDTRRKAAVVAAFRDAARDWAEEDDDNSAEDLLPDYRSIRARAAHERARQIEDGEVDL